MPFAHAAFGRVRYAIGENLRLDLNALSALDRYDVVINPQVEIVLLDRATIQLGALILRGDRDGFFGPFADNTRARASIEVSF